MEQHDVDLAMLVLRLALGPMLFVHGWNKVFGAGGLAGTARWFESLGLHPPGVHARVAAATEMAAGLLMTIGLLAGPVAAAYVGLMIVATLTDHRGKGYFIFRGGCEYTVLVAMVAVSYASLGPGRWSVDHLLSIDLAGLAWAAAAGAAGVLAAGALLAVCYRPRSTNTT